MNAAVSPTSKTTALLNQLVVVFREYGYEGATLNKLAEATGLGKASLYHHFPGGKAEMAATLVRMAVTDLEHSAFARLAKRGSPAERLEKFVDGFSRYVQDGDGHCLLAVFSQGTAWEMHGGQIAEQFAAWHDRLASTFEEAGRKPKRAQREASSLLSQLYGELTLARLLAEPKHFRQAIKRIKRSLPALSTSD